MVSPTPNGPAINDLQYRYFYGWKTYVFGITGQAALTALQAVTNAAGRVGGGMLYNPNASVAYIQCFDSTGGVTLGTTQPTFIIPLAASSQYPLEVTDGIPLLNGLQVAATTTTNGNTAVGSGITGTLFYQ